MIPNGGKIVGAIGYINGNPVLAAEEMTIPDVTLMTVPINPLGSNGEINMVIPKIENMQAEIKATAPSGALAKAAFSLGSLVTFEAYGTYQVTDPVTGGIYAIGDRVVMIGKGLGMGMGSQSNSEGGERVGKFEIRALTYYCDGEEIFRYSGAPGNELVIDGCDHMADHRRNLGL